MVHNPDFNGKQQAGAGRYQVAQKESKRCSAAVAYLHPIADRPNLTVITGAHVKRIIIKDGKALEVGYQVDNRVSHTFASKEVILSAGAMASPPLLMLSGIGPADELTKHNIKMHLDLPGVGKNLQDHLNISVLARTKKANSLYGVDKGIGALATGYNIIGTNRPQGPLTALSVVLLPALASAPIGPIFSSTLYP